MKTKYRYQVSIEKSTNEYSMILITATNKVGKTYSMAIAFTDLFNYSRADKFVVYDFIRTLEIVICNANHAICIVDKMIFDCVNSINKPSDKEELENNNEEISKLKEENKKLKEENEVLSKRLSDIYFKADRSVINIEFINP